MNEHRIGLKPVQRRVWAPIGQLPERHHGYFLWVTMYNLPLQSQTG